MSKTKTKRARRELKREGQRKIAAHQKKTLAASKPKSTPTTAKPQSKKQKTDSTPTSQAPPATASKSTSTPQASQSHKVPFGTYSHILLVGEGDFSFTRSLVQEHGCANVTATSFDTEEEVLSKYPGFAETREVLGGLAPPVPLHHGIDATKISSYKHLRCPRDDEGGEEGEEGEEGWDIIAFQFPHTGGLSTDQNRQVRANQALLVEFFKSCLETTTPKQRLARLIEQSTPRNLVAKPPRHKPFLRLGGRIIITLFEGSPYTLWNIRDLARHVGLKVVESQRFDWGMYPGYRHVRTLGEVEDGGGWKGEDREARMYVFEKVGVVADEDEIRELEKMGIKMGKGKGRGGGEGRKRKKGADGDEDSD